MDSVSKFNSTFQPDKRMRWFGETDRSLVGRPAPKVSFFMTTGRKCGLSCNSSAEILRTPIQHNFRGPERVLTISPTRKSSILACRSGVSIKVPTEKQIKTFVVVSMFSIACAPFGNASIVAKLALPSVKKKYRWPSSVVIIIIAAPRKSKPFTLLSVWENGSVPENSTVNVISAPSTNTTVSGSANPPL